VFAKLNSQTVEKQNDRLSATAIKYGNELKFAYSRVRVRLGRPYALYGRPYALYGRPYAQNFVMYAHGRQYA